MVKNVNQSAGILPTLSQADTPWLQIPEHRQWLAAHAKDMWTLHRASLNPQGGYYTLGLDGQPLPDTLQELHSTTRLVHSYALGKLSGIAGCDALIDQGMDYLWSAHRDTDHGGYLWGIDQGAPADTRKLAYGHVFVLLAGASAKMAGHPDANRLIEDVWTVLDNRFWEAGPNLFADEFNRDWSPLSDYRGMNANMHATEALLAAFEATDETIFLDRAGQILNFFIQQKAPDYDMHLPEHYDAQWNVDTSYDGDPMFRPAGTTPGHSFELGRLLLHYWDLTGQTVDWAPSAARKLIYRALRDGWDKDRGGIVYTLGFDHNPLISDRYWWPVTEAIGAMATLIKAGGTPEDEDWYRKLWTFASDHFIDHDQGGWFPEIDADGQPTSTQFAGKPDIYHALQAAVFPLSDGISRMAGSIKI